jgi:lysophospholipase L1-like esterase
MNTIKKLLIIFISVAIIICCAYFNSLTPSLTSSVASLKPSVASLKPSVASLKEGMSNKNKAVLIGDSILNNSAYVVKGKSVPDLLKSKISILNVAQDGATVADLYAQLDKVPLELNDRNTYVFISAGGNDILNKKIKLNDNKLTKLFDNYMAFLKALRVKLGSAKINVLNLYLPSNPRYESYNLIVDKWNKLLDENSNNVGNSYNIVDINSKLVSAKDFVYDIEPSEIGSVKIADAIYLTR